MLSTHMTPAFATGVKIAMAQLGVGRLPTKEGPVLHVPVMPAWARPRFDKVAMPVPPPGAAAGAAKAAPGLLNRLGNTKIPLKVLGGMGALAGGAMLAHQATQAPTLEVQPSLPLRTVFP